MSISSAIDRIISDWKDLLSGLVTAQVRFLVVGGYAVMKYTEPYHTKDLDLWTDPEPANAARLHGALASRHSDFNRPALAFDAARVRRGELSVGGVAVPRRLFRYNRQQ